MAIGARRLGGPLAIVAALLGGACSSAPGTDGEDLGVARVALGEVPPDAQCLQLSAAGTRSVVKRFSLIPGVSAMLEMAGLPLGNVQFSAVVFPDPCETSVSVEPTWVGDPVTANIVKGEIAQVLLVLHRNGQAAVSVDFCDADVRSDITNCGLCGHVCAAGPFAQPICTTGRCGLTCDAGHTDCDGDAANGCEAVLDTDIAHCGSCDNRCPTGPFAQATCGNGSCALSCNPGHADCDGDPANGCEINVNADANHCGACGRACDGGQVCRAGVCTVPAATVAAGDFHACAVINGAAACWGTNNDGQLGNGTIVDTKVPVQVTGLTSGVTAVAAGSRHACALVNGGVRCWGRNTVGQLGNGSTSTSRVPVEVQGLGSGVTAIAAGYYHTCAIVNGGLKCWGWNAYGQLGNNSSTNSSVPVQVQGLASGVTAISLGGYYAEGTDRSCAVVNGGVQCWGLNGHGALGHDASLVPIQVPGLTSGVSGIAVGVDHTCAIVNGGVQCWGLYNIGQPNWDRTTSTMVPVPVPGLASDVTDIAAGDFLTCALVDGGARCVGANTIGEVGDGTTSWATTPVPVLGLSSGVTALTIGTNQSVNHVCAMVDGGVRCWGNNFNGELGIGSVPSSSIPVLLGGVFSTPPCECVAGSERCDQYMRPNFCVQWADGCGHWAPVNPPPVDGCGGVYPYNYPQGPVCQDLRSPYICYADSAGCKVAGVCPNGGFCSGYPRVGPGRCLPLCTTPSQVDCVQ